MNRQSADAWRLPPLRRRAPAFGCNSDRPAAKEPLCQREKILELAGAEKEQQEHEVWNHGAEHPPAQQLDRLGRASAAVVQGRKDVEM